MIYPEPATLIVDGFMLDLATGELESNGARTRLQGKPFQVLRMLVEQAGEVVTREQFCERLWPQGTYLEFEMGLNRAVRKLRAVLQDDADEPRYIETLPRRGYRLVAAVKSSEAEAAKPIPGGRGHWVAESTLEASVSLEPFVATSERKDQELQGRVRVKIPIT
jgi:DNA-binding winged helix-turn-helix (wHTH) protein